MVPQQATRVVAVRLNEAEMGLHLSSPVWSGQNAVACHQTRLEGLEAREVQEASPPQQMRKRPLRLRLPGSWLGVSTTPPGRL